MSALLAIGIAALTATTSQAATSTRASTLTAFIAPTLPGESNPVEPFLDERTLAVFDSTFAEAAGDVFSWRRMNVITGSDAANAVETLTQDGTCKSMVCMRDVARGVGATHALSARLTKMRDQSCTVVVALFDLLQDKELFHDKKTIKPCTHDNVLSMAIDLGKRAADGPRAPVQVTLNLTRRELRPLDIPNIDDLRLLATVTSTVPRKRPASMPLERALGIYKDKHVFTFEDEAHPSSLFVVRNGRMIDECELRRTASADLPLEVREFCDGNDWEYAWIAFPVGTALIFYSGDKLDHSGGILTLLIGVMMSGASAALALMMNVDGTDPEEGLHYSSRDTIEALVKKSNDYYRDSLELTEEEVVEAGMRK